MRSLTIHEKEVRIEVDLAGEEMELEYYLFEKMPSVKCELLLQARRRRESIYSLTVKGSEEQQLIERLKKYCEEEGLVFKDSPVPALPG